jgi:hypothetical protein
MALLHERAGRLMVLPAVLGFGQDAAARHEGARAVSRRQEPVLSGLTGAMKHP